MVYNVLKTQGMFTYIYFKMTWTFNNFLDLLHNNIRFYYILYILKVPLKSKFDVLITVEIRIQNFSVRLQTCMGWWKWGGGWVGNDNPSTSIALPRCSSIWGRGGVWGDNVQTTAHSIAPLSSYHMPL